MQKNCNKFALAFAGMSLVSVAVGAPVVLEWNGSDVDFKAEVGGTTKYSIPASGVVISNVATVATSFGETTDRVQLRDWTTESNFTDDRAILTWDGGLYGAMTIRSQQYQIYALAMAHVCLAGNHVNECVFSGDGVTVTDGGGTNNVFYTKRGSGTWRLTETYRDELRGGWAIEEGVLKVPSIASIGKKCSMGTATQVAEPEHRAWDDARRVDYAIRLGAGDAKEGTLEYNGSAALNVVDRTIAVKGNGRLRNGTDYGMSYSGIRSVGAQASVFTVDGESTTAVNEISNVKDGAASGSLKLVKDGAGSWTARGDLEFTGGIEVKQGKLTVRNVKNYSWFKFRVVENQGGKAGVVDSYSKYVTINELGLFDADGNRCNTNLTAGSATSIAEGQYYTSAGANKSWPTVNSFDDDGTTIGSVASSEDYISSMDESSQIDIVMHLPEDVEHIASCDWVAGHSYSSGRSSTVMRAWKLFGSFDGKTWHEIGAETEGPEKATANKWAYSGETFVSGAANTGKALDYTIPADEQDTVFPTGVSSVQVASGATLEVYGERITAQGLVLDVQNGAGTIRKFQFSENGVITLLNKTDGSPVEIPVALEDCRGEQNLVNWQVLYKGRMHPCKVELRADSIYIEPVRKGLVLYVR